MNNILVTGAKGQLGNELSKLQHNYPNWNFVFTDLPEVDICNIQQIEKFVVSKQINAIINCAAYTAVDKAESDIELATKVNVAGPKILAEVSQKFGLKFIHISTDFVFDGKTFLPYKESDTTTPISVYGNTKKEAELVVLAANPNSIIIRTSWLYSAFGNNFVKTMRRLGQEKKELKVIVDQVGSPTWAADLAQAILNVLSDPQAFTSKTGIYHYSNEGVASWYDFAYEIIGMSNLTCTVMPISTDEYPTAAKRPHYSVLDKTKIKQAFNLTIPHWKESLKKCIDEMEI